MHYLFFYLWRTPCIFFFLPTLVISTRTSSELTKSTHAWYPATPDTWQGWSRNSGTSSPWCKSANQMPACASVLHVWQLFRKSSNRPGKCAREHNWQRSSGLLFQCYIIDSLQTLTCTQGTNNVTDFSCYCLNYLQPKLYFLPGLYFGKVQLNTLKLIYSR